MGIEVARMQSSDVELERRPTWPQMLTRLLASWLVGCVVVVWVRWMRWTELAVADVALLAIGSAAIGLMAMLPMARWPWRWWARWSQAGDADDLRPFVASMLGMGIRMVGTVALFLAGRYQMDAPHGEIAAMVLGWYVYLTFVEILLVVRGARVRSGAASAPSVES